MKTFFLSFTVSLLFLAGSIIAMRSQRLREQTALLWLSVSLATVFLSLTLPTHLLDRVSLLVGVSYGPALVFLLAVVFLTILVFHLSIRFDRLRANQVTLVQEIALMRTPPLPTVERIEETGDAAKPDAFYELTDST